MEPKCSLPCSWACYWTPSWATRMKSTSSHPISLRSILILFLHLYQCLPSGPVSSDIPIKTLDAFLISPMHVTCPIYLTLDFIILVTFDETLYYAVFSILLLLPLIQIFSSALCFQVPSIYVLPLWWKIKFHTHTKQVNIASCLHEYNFCLSIPNIWNLPLFWGIYSLSLYIMSCSLVKRHWHTHDFSLHLLLDQPPY